MSGYRLNIGDTGSLRGGMDGNWKDPRGLDPPIMPGSPKNRVFFGLLEASWEFFRVFGNWIPENLRRHPSLGGGEGELFAPQPEINATFHK